jgi:glyoxylase-like metal-dependent hydrolase (beta-lactamase superfamily II)
MPGDPPRRKRKQQPSGPLGWLRKSAHGSTATAEEKEVVEGRVNVVNDQLIQHIVTVKLFTRTFPTSNVWVLRDGNEAVLIDAGFGDEASSQVRIDYLTRELSNLDFKYIAITHHHFDHSSGGRRLREALHADVAINPVDEQLLHTPSESNEDLPDDREIDKRAQIWRAEALATPIDTPMVDGDTVRFGNLTLRAVHTPGHTAGHNCYWVEELGVLFTGDNILGIGTSAIGPPPNGDMEHYLQSLLRMRELQAKLFAPGHGPVVTATASKVQELIDHRGVRDQQILALIEKGYGTDRQLRNAMYPEIQPGLRRAARGQLRAHLARLVGQGRVTVEEDGKTWKVALTR